MPDRPFHHGNLRAVLLEQAEEMLRTTGVDGLSLRELARQAGVSHGAPRSHFIDRQALLDALAVRGFERFTRRVQQAVGQPVPFDERFRLVGRAYVDFAVDDAALMELMFAVKTDGTTGPVHIAAARLFGVLDEAMVADGGGDGGDRGGDGGDGRGDAGDGRGDAGDGGGGGRPATASGPGDGGDRDAAAPATSAATAPERRDDGARDDARDRFKLLFAATMQGTATLIAARRISRAQGETVVDDATTTLLASPLGRRALARP